MFATGAVKGIGRTNARSFQGKDAYGGLVENVTKPNANAVWFTIQGSRTPSVTPSRRRSSRSRTPEAKHALRMMPEPMDEGTSVGPWRDSSRMAGSGVTNTMCE
jgi:hypothetical protein